MTDIASRHDAGGKSILRLLPGVVGHAEFRGERDEHRLTLERRWDMGIEQTDAPFALWSGMNPSTAEGHQDDLTVRKEQTWTRGLGLCRYVKVNFGSFRSTDPAGLVTAGVPIAHPENLPMVLSLARAAHTVVLACGKPPEVLQPYAKEAIGALHAEGISMLCLGVTAEGWPKHSSRLGYATPFDIFDPTRILQAK